MGINACVYVKTTDGNPPGIRFAADVEPDLDNPGWFTVGECQLDRFYSETYPSGYWPTICGVLLECFASPNTELVKYFGDCVDSSDVDPITLDRVFELSRYWVKYRNDPAPMVELLEITK